MCHDPSRYHDPFEFRPERFLSNDGREPEPDPKRLIFGFARRYISVPRQLSLPLKIRFCRICPGKEFADVSLFIAISMILATFDILKAQDEFGRDVVPPVEYIPGVLKYVLCQNQASFWYLKSLGSHPKRFACRIVPRSENVAVLIKTVKNESAYDIDDSRNLPPSSIHWASLRATLEGEPLSSSFNFPFCMVLYRTRVAIDSHVDLCQRLLYSIPNLQLVLWI